MPPPLERLAHATWIAGVLFACTITIIVAGYQFGGSNHTVYLLDALRHADPALLQRDWFTTHTLQYHALFGLITRGLMRLGLLRPAFLIGYLATIVLIQASWAGIARRLGCSPATYLIGVVLYYLLAAGTGLGFFSLEQDGAFLPSNVANAALLCAIYLYLAGHLGRSWLMVGVAGLFHLNHAVTGAAVWSVLTLLQWRRARAEWVGIAVGLLLCIVNVALAARVVLGRSGKLPLDEFVALYVRLRHPHHMDVYTWPVAVWACFILPVVAGGIVARRLAPPAAEWVRFRGVFLAFTAVIAVALLTAGFWILGESFVQMQWYRFSVYPKLFGCTACAYGLAVAWHRSRKAVIAIVAITLGIITAGAAFMTGEQARVLQHVLSGRAPAIALLILTAAVGLLATAPRLARMRSGRPALAVAMAWAVLVPLLAWNHLGLRPVAGDDPDYLALCDWARANTPTDALFVVPPGEESFRLRAARAIVVNFKAIPQLSAEMAEWRDRLQAVTGMDDLKQLHGTFEQKRITMDDRYALRPADALRAVADRYSADFVVALQPWPDVQPAHHIGRYWVYPAR